MFGFGARGLCLIAAGMALAASATPRDNAEDIRYMEESYKNSLRKFPTLLSCYSRYAARNGEEAAYNVLREIIQKRPGSYYIAIDSGLAAYGSYLGTYDARSLTHFLSRILRAIPVEDMRTALPIRGVGTFGRLYSLLVYKMTLQVQHRHDARDGVTQLFTQFCENNSLDLTEYLYQPNKLVPVPESARCVLGGDETTVPSIVEMLASFRDYIKANRPTYRVQLDALAQVEQELVTAYCCTAGSHAQSGENIIER